MTRISQIMDIQSVNSVSSVDSQSDILYPHICGPVWYTPSDRAIVASSSHRKANQMQRTQHLVAALVLLLIASAACGAPRPAGAALPQLHGCTIFPADNVWNTPIDKLPVDPNSNA